MQRPIFLLFSFTFVSCQIFLTGNPSDIDGCSDCAFEHDPDLSCWQTKLKFYEDQLITQLRHYVSIEVDIDQWYRYHNHSDQSVGRDPKAVLDDITAQFLAQLEPNDILSTTTVTRIASNLAARVSKVANELGDNVPHFSCPATCDYSHNITFQLFFVMIALNVFMAINFVPGFINSLRPDPRLKSKQQRTGTTYSRM